MAEDNKKPKIDLRARLGKKSAGPAGPSIPPPIASPAAQASIPSPPFGSKAPVSPSFAPTPSMAASPSMVPSPARAGVPGLGQAPAAAQPAPKPRIAEPQAIKIEMSEEIVQAQKKGRSRVMMIAGATCVVGALIGTQLGGGLERRKRQNIALEGAKMLTDDIDKANGAISKMADILAAAKRSLSDGDFPEKQVKELADAGISFDGSYLYGKGTGLMNPKINKQLVDFAGKAEAANEQRERLQLVLSSAQTPITKLLQQAEKPEFNWSVYVVAGPHGPMAAMQPIPKPFLVSSKEKVKNKDGKMVAYNWPEEIEVPADGGKKEKLKFYKKGNPVSRDPLLIPVEPSTQAYVCPNDTMVRLRQEIVKLEQLLKGDRSDPTNEKAGLIDLGNQIIDELKGIGVGG